MATKTAPKPKPPAAPVVVRAPAPPTAVPPGSRAGNLAVADLRPSPTNPRKSFPDESLASLADSIRSVGVRQRLLVRPVPEPGHPAPRYDTATGQWVGLDHFEVIAGERRLRAARLAGLDAVPVDVCDLTEDQVLLVQLVENDQREDVRPSEQAAAYKRLADAGRTAEQIATDTGKPVGFVRGLLRLGRLPAWALAAVDAGALPRATAELVARVPGEESRKRAAACALLGLVDPKQLDGVWNDDEGWEEAAGREVNHDTPLSYRDTRDLIRNHFTKELKGSPFSLKVLYARADTLGTGREMFIQSCEECPKRAGNDAEAVADGTRADVCLDPDCYREKVEAYRAQEVAKAAAKGVVPVPDDFSWYMRNGQPPNGWFEPKAKLSATGDVYAACVFHKNDDRREMPLDRLLNKVLPQQYLAFDFEGKPRKLVRAKDVRAALLDLGVIPKPKPVKKAPLTDTGSEPDGAATKSEQTSRERPPAPKRGEPGWQPSQSDLYTRVAGIAGSVAFETGAENQDGLEGLSALGDASTSAPWEALKLLAMHAIEDARECGDETLLQDGVIKGVDIWGRDDDEKGLWPAWKSWLDRADPAQLIGLLLKSAMIRCAKARAGSLDRSRTALLEWCELDWQQLEEQARRELAGGETAEAKLDKAEAAEPAPATPAVTAPPKAKKKAVQK